jgi:hypothetical protein
MKNSIILFVTLTTLISIPKLAFASVNVGYNTSSSFGTVYKESVTNSNQPTAEYSSSYQKIGDSQKYHQADPTDPNSKYTDVENQVQAIDYSTFESHGISSTKSTIVEYGVQVDHNNSVYGSTY